MDKSTYEWVKTFLTQEPALAHVLVRDIEAHRQLVAMAADKKIGVPANGVAEWINHNARTRTRGL